MVEARERLTRRIRGASAIVSGQGASGDETIICRVYTMAHEHQMSEMLLIFDQPEIYCDVDVIVL